jgi:predicted double-glycine peptidase
MPRPAIIRIPYRRQTTCYTCGPACLRMVLAWAGKSAVSEKQIARLVGTRPATGTTRRAMIGYLRKLGLSGSSLTKGTVADLRAALGGGTPIIVNYLEPFENEGHYAVAVGVDGTNIILHDPDHAAHFHMPLIAFAKRWLGHRSKDKKRGWMLVVQRSKKV